MTTFNDFDELDPDPDEDEEEAPYSDDEDWEELDWDGIERNPPEPGVVGDMDNANQWFEDDGGLTAEAYAWLAERDYNNGFC
jgi:hypothetical protein